MIKQVKINGFQNHKQTKIDLSPSVNFFVGTGDSGKSAIIRAIKWACFNTATGKSFINRDTDQARVEVLMDDCDIVRTRNKKTLNSYELNGDLLKAFGQGSVDVVMDAHGIDEELSCQGQHDGAFLLSWSKPDASRFLNKLIDLDKTDRAQKYLNTKSLQIRGRLKTCKEKVEQCDDAIELLSFVPDAMESVNTMEKLDESIQSKSKRVDQLENTIEQHRRISKQLSDYNWINSAMNEVNVCKEQVEHIELLQNQIDVYSNLCTSYHDTKERLSAYDKLQDAVKNTDEIDKQINAIEEVEQQVSDIENVLNQYDEIVDQMEKVEEELKGIEKDGKRFGEICPVCGSKADWKAAVCCD